MSLKVITLSGERTGKKKHPKVKKYSIVHHFKDCMPFLLFAYRHKEPAEGNVKDTAVSVRKNSDEMFDGMESLSKLTSNQVKSEQIEVIIIFSEI